MTSGSRPTRRTGSTDRPMMRFHGPAAAEIERSSWAARSEIAVSRSCSHYKSRFSWTMGAAWCATLCHQILSDWKIWLENLTEKSDWKIPNLTEKPAHLSDFHCPSPFFGQWFHSSNSFKVQSSKNNSHLQRGETQCALYTPAFDSYNYFSAPYKFCFTEFNEIVCRVGARLGPH